MECDGWLLVVSVRVDGLRGVDDDCKCSQSVSGDVLSGSTNLRQQKQWKMKDTRPGQ